MEKTYADTEKTLMSLVEIADRINNHYVVFHTQEDSYLIAVSLFELLTKDFIRERSNVKKIMERFYRGALDFFITSTPTSEPTKYTGVIKNIVDEAKRQLDLTFCGDSLEKIIEELDYIRKEKRFDKYEHNHYGMWVDWDEYAKREKAIDEEMKKFLEDMKKRNE